MAEPLSVGGQLGSYLIESVIGRGGMSTVYRARHSRLGTAVALKVLAPELSNDDKFRERFLREAKMAAGIDHPNVVPIYDTGLHDDALYMVMRYVAGGDLKALLRASGPLSAQQTLAILGPVARALDAAHGHGLVHRDVKPANILIQRAANGEIEHIYLSDFGITKHAGSVSGLTGTGALVGTVDYMAPEQIESGTVSARTDVYALGCVFYQCVTGRVPFERDGDAAVLWAHVSDSVEQPSAVNSAVPAALDAPIARAMAKDPADRYGGCRDFIDACTAALGAGAGVATGTGTPTQVSEPTEPVTPPPVPVAAAAAAPAQAQAPPGPPGPPAPPSQAPAPREPSWISRHLGVVALGAVLLLGVVVAAVVLGGGGSDDKKGSAGKTTTGTAVAGESFPGGLTPIPTNRVKADGRALIRLNGDRATVVIKTNALLDGAPHAMHIHAGAQGQCPPASAAHAHNGHDTISTTDGIPFYGPPRVAVTTRGDTSLNSILAFRRFPSVGDISYIRTITLPPSVARLVRDDNAVIIVHGIDYNSNGVYDSVLDKSELDRSVPGEATAPALCGPLKAAASNSEHAESGRGRLYTASLVVQPGEVGWICRIV